MSSEKQMVHDSASMDIIQHLIRLVDSSISQLPEKFICNYFDNGFTVLSKKKKIFVSSFRKKLIFGNFAFKNASNYYTVRSSVDSLAFVAAVILL